MEGDGVRRLGPRLVRRRGCSVDTDEGGGGEAEVDEGGEGGTEQGVREVGVEAFEVPGLGCSGVDVAKCPGVVRGDEVVRSAG
jgi:hypothetical protein